MGFTTNGEWYSLRSKGNTRPLSVLQIRSDVCAKYAHSSSRKLHGMLSPKGKLQLCSHLYVDVVDTDVYSLLLLCCSLCRWHYSSRNTKSCYETRVAEGNSVVEEGRCWDSRCHYTPQAAHYPPWLRCPQLAARYMYVLPYSIVGGAELQHSQLV